MFLYNKERNGRIPNEVAYSKAPELVWKIQFKQYPIRCAESTPVADADNNIYFGSHDGSFYCVNPDGQIKWQFVTESKIYSSPLIFNNHVYFNFGRSNMACFDLNGNKKWIIDGMSALKNKSKFSRLFSHIKSYLYYDYEFKKFMKINAWSSPNILNDGTLLTVLCSKGLYALDANSGAEKWSYKPGELFYHQAGVAITTVNGEERIFFVSQANGLHVLDTSGNLIWEKKSISGYNGWANPSIDPEENAVYHSISKHNQSCYLYKHSLDGKLLWEKKFNFGCRATVGVPTGNSICFLGLNGKAYKIDKKNGAILAELSIASSDRGLWTSPAILENGSVLINTKKSVQKGSLICISKDWEINWEINYGKALSVPYIDQLGYLYTGTWDGDYYKFKEQKI